MNENFNVKVNDQVYSNEDLNREKIIEILKTIRHEVKLSEAQLKNLKRAMELKRDYQVFVMDKAKKVKGGVSIIQRSGNEFVVSIIQVK